MRCPLDRAPRRPLESTPRRRAHEPEGTQHGIPGGDGGHVCDRLIDLATGDEDQLPRLVEDEDTSDAAPERRLILADELLPATCYWRIATTTRHLYASLGATTSILTKEVLTLKLIDISLP